MSKHTPGDLKVHPVTDKRHRAISVMSVNGDDLIASVTAVHVSWDVAQANADRIVLAWNNFDAMAKALRDLRDDLAKLKWGQRYPGRNHAIMDKVDAILARIDATEKNNV